MTTKITDVARVVRSKNAGPFELTLDIILRERSDYEHLRDNEIITREKIAELYGIPVEDVLHILCFEPANAIKITLKRPIPSGAPGETDVYGAQQHAPLFALEW